MFGKSGAYTVIVEYDYQNSRFRKIRRLIAVAVGGLLVALLLFLQANANNVVKSAAEAAMRSFTASAVNDAVLQTLTEGMKYNELVHVERDDSGDIVAITSDSLEINRIARTTVRLAQEKLEERSEGGVGIPFGAFTGIEAWSGFGPEINMKIIPVSTVECSFSSEFSTAGINQTRHAVYLTVCAAVSVVLPSGTSVVSTQSQVLLCESILVGKVPDVYFQTDIFGTAAGNVTAVT